MPGLVDSLANALGYVKRPNAPALMVPPVEEEAPALPDVPALTEDDIKKMMGATKKSGPVEMPTPEPPDAQALLDSGNFTPGDIRNILAKGNSGFTTDEVAKIGVKDASGSPIESSPASMPGEEEKKPSAIMNYVSGAGKALGKGVGNFLHRTDSGTLTDILSVLSGGKVDLDQKGTPEELFKKDFSRLTPEEQAFVKDNYKDFAAGQKGMDPKAMLELKKLMREDANAYGFAVSGSQDQKDVADAGKSYKAMKQWINTINDAAEKGDVTRIQKALQNTELINRMKDGINRAPAGTPLADNANSILGFLSSSFDTIDTAQLPGLLASVADLGDAFERQKEGLMEMYNPDPEVHARYFGKDNLDPTQLGKLRAFGAGNTENEESVKLAKSALAKLERDASQISGNQSTKNLEATALTLKALGAAIGGAVGKSIEGGADSVLDRLKGKIAGKPKPKKEEPKKQYPVDPKGRRKL